MAGGAVGRDAGTAGDADGPSHHLTDALLMAYAAGGLPEGYALAVAAHLSMCDHCRARAMAFEAAGGALLDTVEPAPLDARALSRLLDRLGAAEGDAPAPATESTRGRTASGATARPLPAPLGDWLGTDDPDALRWRTLGGVGQVPVTTDGPARARLLRIPAGQAMPSHGHAGLEMTLVLRGAFRDGHDRYGPGDVELADADLSHTPVAEPGEDCLCLAVTDAPLRFDALLPRLAQRVMGI
ncbi:MAG: ChrR family anti-sigma-E factor [Paracoccaceae bacterium]